MGLGAVAKAYPNQLSGGMQQRVAIARALMSRPAIVLMDEPFGALDAQTREVMHDLIAHVQRQEGSTIVFVTHDVDEAILLGDRIAVLTAGAHIEQLAAPGELLARPANEFVADFLGHDRGLKLLSLVPATEVPVDPVHAVDGWRLVTDDDQRPVGWANGHAGGPVPVNGIGPRDSARSLLDAAVSAPTGCAVRVDDDRKVVGLVRYESIGKLLGERLQAAT
jgi:osmoprotectant transport system ATP-binding protein